jgi:hypothetical protein
MKPTRTNTRSQKKVKEGGKEKEKREKNKKVIGEKM